MSATALGGADFVFDAGVAVKMVSTYTETLVLKACRFALCLVGECTGVGCTWILCATALSVCMVIVALVTVLTKGASVAFIALT